MHNSSCLETLSLCYVGSATRCRDTRRTTRRDHLFHLWHRRAPLQQRRRRHRRARAAHVLSRGPEPRPALHARPAEGYAISLSPVCASRSPRSRTGRGEPLLASAAGVVHAGVTHRVLLCNDFKTLFIDPPSHGRRAGHAAPTGHQMAPDAVSSHDGIVSACD